MSRRWGRKKLNKKQTVLNVILIFASLCIMFYQLIFHFSTMSLAKILTTTSILPIIMIPYLIDKIFSYHPSPTLLNCYYLFVLLTLSIGSVLGFYQRIAWFDLLMHWISGEMSVLISWILLERFHLLKQERKEFIFLFSILFAVSIACGWEFFEFFSDKIFGGDTQYVIETGVNDTMEDLGMGTLGSFFVASVTFCQMKRKHQTIQKIEKVVKGEAE